jgi:all-trans-retinol 13,14-reductase
MFIVIGGGRGGLTASWLVAQAGRKILLVERNHDVGGAASIYKVGNRRGSASPDPRSEKNSKRRILNRLGVLEDVDWIPMGAV